MLAVTKRWRPSSSTGARRALARRSATRRAATSPPTPAIMHGELVAAEAGDHVAGAQHAAQALGDDLEQAVAGAVAERVVDDLEVVEVDEQHRDLERLRRRRSASLQALQEERAVRQAGERVVVGLVVELALDALALGDVEARGETQYGGRAVAVVDERVLPQRPSRRRRRRA